MTRRDSRMWWRRRENEARRAENEARRTAEYTALALVMAIMLDAMPTESRVKAERGLQQIIAGVMLRCRLTYHEDTSRYIGTGLVR
jgi:hypothetical protein